MQLRLSRALCLSSFLVWSNHALADLNADSIAAVNDKNAFETIVIDIDASNDGWEDHVDPPYELETAAQYDDPIPYNDQQIDPSSESESTTDLPAAELETEELQSLIKQPELPGEEIDFRLKLHSSTHHIVEGRVDSDIGKIRFKSRLLASNEVKLSLTLKQKDLDDIELVAYFDLANYTMELDGSNSVLNQAHKQLMRIAVIHLRATLSKQYEGYEVPEHAFMLAQMFAYWSVSPDGFVHDKQSITSR